MTELAKEIIPIRQEPEITPLEAAKKLIEEQKQKDVTDCEAALPAFLKQFNCRLDVAFSYDPVNKLKKHVIIINV